MSTGALATCARRPSILACCESVDQASPQGAGRTLHITVESGRLVGDVDGRGNQSPVAMSETEFTGLYGLGVQFIDGGLYVKHESGNYRFVRK